MPDTISTPVGTLTIHQPDQGPALAQGTTYEWHPEGIFFLIQLNEEHSTTQLPYGFIRDKLHHLDRYCRDARQFLIAEFGCPDGEESTFITHPEVTFWDNAYWSVRFAEGTLDICRPNGVLVHWKGDHIIGYDDLSLKEKS
ncbi:hypothetical protein [Paenibacillus bovis]|uniref:Uncharacterized protein n=1 Tax=Paenibacillus bovis TaxID=1616788 RepID=A0A172ZD78_9BACL|nr:hypothetical protein [Paenibacillus bovis]ANF95595.1 hypothetical protein AR543_05980 [Paenibacillus bovis]